MDDGSQRTDEAALQLCQWRERDLPRIVACAPGLSQVDVEDAFDLAYDELVNNEAFLAADADKRAAMWARGLRCRTIDKQRERAGRTVTLEHVCEGALHDPAVLREHPELDSATRHEEELAQLAVERLPDRDRALIELCHRFDIPRSSIAAALNVDVKTLYAWHKRVMTKLHHIIAIDEPTVHCRPARALIDSLDPIADSSQHWLDEHLASCRRCTSYKQVHVLAGLLILAPSMPWWKVKLAALAHTLHLAGRGAGQGSGAGGAVAGGSGLIGKLTVGGAGAALTKALAVTAVAVVGVAGISQVAGHADTPRHRDPVQEAAAAIPITPVSASGQTQMASWAHANEQAAAQTRRHHKKKHKKRRHHKKHHHAAAYTPPAAAPAPTYTQPAPAPYTPPATSSGGSGGGGSSSGGSGGGSHEASGGLVDRATGPGTGTRH